MTGGGEGEAMMKCITRVHAHAHTYGSAGNDNIGCGNLLLSLLFPSLSLLFFFPQTLFSSFAERVLRGERGGNSLTLKAISCFLPPFSEVRKGEKASKGAGGGVNGGRSPTRNNGRRWGGGEEEGKKGRRRGCKSAPPDCRCRSTQL